jgi:hypothetical protein
LAPDRIPYTSWTGKTDNKFFSFTPACCIHCNDETAWSFGNRYVARGNWATYTPYSGTAKSVILYAAQFMEAGKVYFTPSGNNVNIFIELNEGWSLSEDVEPVKIQGYNDAPIVSPVPGNFITYKGSSLNINAAIYNYYGIHLDLRYCQ